MCNLSYGIAEDAMKKEKISSIINMLKDHLPINKIKLYVNATDADISRAREEMEKKEIISEPPPAIRRMTSGFPPSGAIHPALRSPRAILFPCPVQ